MIPKICKFIIAKTLYCFPTSNPRAFFADRQLYGKGQRGRNWFSPKGGIWLSAAIPCDRSNKYPGLFGLAVAVTLANRLEKILIPVQIKWPNDLLVYKRKLAGLLPRVVYRGNRPVYLCLGIGLNMLNRVPKEGISLGEIIDKDNFSLKHWYLEVLIAIEKAYFLLSQPELICSEGERMLWSTQIKRSDTGEIWDIQGLDGYGRLKVCRGFKKQSWNRWE